MSDPLTYLRQAVARTTNGLKMMLGRGRVILVGDDDKGPTQMLQVKMSAKETMDLYRLAEFGFTSRPPKDSDCVAVFLNAERTWGVVIATGHQKARKRLLNDGEVCLYDGLGTDGAAGKWIWAKKNVDAGHPGGWEIEANNEPLIVNNAKKVTINAGTDGFLINSTGDGIVDMGGKNLTIQNVGTVKIDNPTAVQLVGAGGRKVVCDGDPVSGGVVHAAGGQKVTAT